MRPSVECWPLPPHALPAPNNTFRADLPTPALASVPGGARGGPPTAAWLGVGYYAGCGFLRNRIVFPIHDQEGPLVAYAGRSLDGSEPRYLFPPGFHKSQVVFNLRRAVGESAGCALVWKDSLTACAYIRLATTTWWPGWASLFRGCRSSYCGSAFPS